MVGMKNPTSMLLHMTYCKYPWKILPNLGNSRNNNTYSSFSPDLSAVLPFIFISLLSCHGDGSVAMQAQ